MVRRMMFALSALALGLTACGGSASRPHAQPSTSASPALTAAKAKALAAAAILRPGDLPGFTHEAQPAEQGDDPNEVAVRACLGMGPSHFLARNQGIKFKRGTSDLTSTADVTYTAEQAKRELDALSSGKAVDCLRTGLTKALKEQGVSASNLVVARVPVSVAGADGAFGYRITFVLAVGGRSVNFTSLQVGAAVGPVEISITAGGSTPLLVTVSDAQRLAAVAAARVSAAL